MPTLHDAVALVHGWYPPETADSWDAVGLVLGDPSTPVRRVLLAVDPGPDVAQEAADWGADLLVVHHPLFLKAVHGFARTTPKARTLGILSDAGCALLTAHTNADQAVGGVSEALATSLGLTGLEPIVAAPGKALDKLSVYVPFEDADAMRSVLAVAGAGAVGDYDQASFTTLGEGRFRPLEGAQPAIGTVGESELVGEARIEVVLLRERRTRVVAAMLAAHRYEEPTYALLQLDDPGTGRTGAGRIGEVAEQSLREFGAHVKQVLPETVHGVRVGGDPDRVVRRVAVCGGAGDFLLDEVAGSDVDVYVTSDLRHHPASEFLQTRGPALVDVAHWAAEWTWLPALGARLTSELGDTVEVRISTTCTDPWAFRP